MFREHLTGFRTDFFAYNRLPSAKARGAISLFDETWKKETIALGESYLGYDFPSLTAKDFMEFSHTGNRSRYEEKCFAKRHALDALVLAEYVENNGRFMDDIVNGIFSICEESAWQLPAHNTYIRDTPQLLLPDATAPILDLFACETGAILATVYYLLKDSLDSYSPFITKRIRHELLNRIYTPYLNCHFWWMGNGKEPMNNWTIWCTQNILISTFLADAPIDLQYPIVEKACGSIDYFLVEYGDDGCCDEGAQYYRHAGLTLFNALEMLNSVTEDHFRPLYEKEKIRNIASYILHAHIADKYYVNFADCSPVAGRCTAREYAYAIRTGNEAMKLFAARDFVAGGKDTLLLPKENNLFYRLQNGYYAKEIFQYEATHREEAIPHSDTFFSSVGLMTAHSSKESGLYLAVKAGDNNDSHNHNDTGSFTIYKNGKPIFIDVGVESYTKKTFSPQRYEIWTMQSGYHNLPTINGFDQKDGASYKATDVIYQMDETHCEIQMELKDAYPSECNIASYQRHAVLEKEFPDASGKKTQAESIRIQDTFAFADGQNGEILMNLMTCDKPVCTECTNGLTLQVGEATMQITAKNEAHAPKLVTIETIEIKDPRLLLAWESPLYRVRIALLGPTTYDLQ